MKVVGAFAAAFLALPACAESGGERANDVVPRDGVSHTDETDGATNEPLADAGVSDGAALDAMSDRTGDFPEAAVPWQDAIEPLVCNGAGARYVTAVPWFQFGPGQDNGRSSFPEIVFGPPKGGGCCMGSLDVVSLGNGGAVVVEFEENAIVDAPGPDFIVFENAFSTSGDAANPFAELATVAVSENGIDWVDFPCTAIAYPYGSCAGWHPVYANPDSNDIDPTDPTVAGGDAFDLADIGVQTARFVRITDRVDLTGTNGVFDLDAVAIVHPLCP